MPRHRVTLDKLLIFLVGVVSFNISTLVPYATRGQWVLIFLQVLSTLTYFRSAVSKRESSSSLVQLCNGNGTLFQAFISIVILAVSCRWIYIRSMVCSIVTGQIKNIYDDYEKGRISRLYDFHKKDQPLSEADEKREELYQESVKAILLQVGLSVCSFWCRVRGLNNIERSLIKIVRLL